MRRLGLAAVIAAVVAAASAVAETRRGPYLQSNVNVYVVSRSGESIRRITRDGRDHLGAVWSPDGTRIADAVQIGDHDKVEILTARGRVLRRFEAGEAFGTAPAWAPDGRSIAYVRSYHNLRRHADDGELVVRPTGGGPPRVVVRFATERPVWTPNGEVLLYIRGDITANEPRFQPTLWRVNLDGSHNHPLVRGKVADPPAVSRNGSRIAYVRQRGKDYELWVADTDGARTQRLLRASYIENPRFAPGGRGIWAFVIAGGQERELLVDESGQRRTLPDLADDWSHDGLLLAGMDETRLATIRPDGTHRRVLVNFRLSQQSPTHEFAACDAIRWAPASDRLLAACGKETAD